MVVEVVWLVSEYILTYACIYISHTILKVPVKAPPALSKLKF
jgi:hypothetical protein